RIEGKRIGAGCRHGNAPAEVSGSVERPFDARADVETIEVGAEAPIAEVPLAPGVLVQRAEILRCSEQLAVAALPLRRARDPVPLTVIFVVEELDRSREEGQRREIGTAVLDDRRASVLHALRAGLHL